MSGNYLFLVEGETEEKLVQLFFLGQVKRVDLWSLKNEKIHTITRLISKKGTKVYIICDVDAINPSNCQNFLQNFHCIKRHVKEENIFILQQTNNFEHELLYSLGLKRKELYEIFHASGEEKLKKNFLAENQLLNKLMENNFDIKKLWIRPIHQSLSTLINFKKSAVDCKSLLKPEVVKKYPTLKDI